MRHRCLAPLRTLAVVGVLTGLGPVSVAAQVPAAKTTTTEALPRLPWGDPDLQGMWTNKTITPFERPKDLAGKPFLTEEEAAEREEHATVQRDSDIDPSTGQLKTNQDGVVPYNAFWLDGGTKVVGTRRTSIIIDPPDGRMPPLTPAAQKRDAEYLDANRGGPANSWEDLDLNDRCILWSVGPPMLPTGYNNNYQILQIPGYVVILVEMIHDVRIIPVDGRPHLGTEIRQYQGDPRGHWEGNTLVVETTNMLKKGNGASWGQDEVRLRADLGDPRDTLRVVERFTRVDADTITYQFTVEDPARWTRPWAGELSMTTTQDKLYEYACHEGNHGIVGILAGARAEEKAAAEAAKKTGLR